MNNKYWTESKCVGCDIIFKHRKYNLKKYCSRKCYDSNRFGENNPNWKGGMISKKCQVCGAEFYKHKSQDYIKGCSKKCSTIMKKEYSIKHNKMRGQTKENNPKLMIMSKLRKGVPRSEETKKKISIGTIKGMRNNWEHFIVANKNRDVSKFKSVEVLQKRSNSLKNNKKIGKWNYKNINFRSNWEVECAKVLDKNNILWEYEPKVFRLNSKTFYIPDFYLIELNVWLEVKGYLSEKSEYKIKLFQKKHALIVLNKVEEFESAIQNIANC